jgi:hypothetical protein
MAWWGKKMGRLKMPWDNDLSFNKGLWENLAQQDELRVYQEAMASYQQACLFGQQNILNNQLGGHYYGDRQALAQAHNYTSNRAVGPWGSSGAAQDAILHTALYSLALQNSLAIQSTDEPKQPIEDAGIKFGEVTGWRIWKLTPDQKLRAFYADAVWEPQTPMTGVVEDHGQAGVWAFKDIKDALKKMIETPGSVYGSVKLWGKVIEYEKGYRAEMASVASIAGSLELANDKLEALAKLYEPRPKETPPCG